MVEHKALTYMMLNGPDYYGAMTALTLCGISFAVLCNVMLFEINNYLKVCDPNFFQSSACRDHIGNIIQSDPQFRDQRQMVHDTLLAGQQNLNDRVAKVRHQLNQESSLDKVPVMQQLQNMVDLLRSSASRYLGNLKDTLESSDPAVPLTLTKIQTMLEETIVDPVKAKYVDPMKKLYQNIEKYQ